MGGRRPSSPAAPSGWESPLLHPDSAPRTPRDPLRPPGRGGALNSELPPFLLSDDLVCGEGSQVPCLVGPSVVLSLLVTPLGPRGRVCAGVPLWALPWTPDCPLQVQIPGPPPRHSAGLWWSPEKALRAQAVLCCASPLLGCSVTLPPLSSCKEQAQTLPVHPDAGQKARPSPQAIGERGLVAPHPLCEGL